MMSVEASKRPVGLVRVAVLNFFLMTAACALAWHYWHDPITRYFLLFGALVWLLLGPGLLIARSGVWQNARRIAYGYSMMLSLFAFMAFIKGLFLAWMWAVIGAMLLVIYLIGLRGYLNSPLVREYFRIPAITEQKAAKK